MKKIRFPDTERIKHKVKHAAGVNKLRTIELSKRAKEHKKRIHRRIKRNLPTNGEQLGKHIERNLSTNQKLWSNAAIALFSRKAIENVSSMSSYVTAVIMLLLVSAVCVFPTSISQLSLSHIVTNFFITLTGLIVIELFSYFCLKAFGSKLRFKIFVSTVNTALFMSIIAISIPLALISFAIFSTMLQSQTALTMLFSMIPFYNYLVFGWTAEVLSRLKGIRAIAASLITLFLMLFLSVLLLQLKI